MAKLKDSKDIKETRTEEMASCGFFKKKRKMGQNEVEGWKKYMSIGGGTAHREVRAESITGILPNGPLAGCPTAIFNTQDSLFGYI